MKGECAFIYLDQNDWGEEAFLTRRTVKKKGVLSVLIITVLLCSGFTTAYGADIQDSLTEYETALVTENESSDLIVPENETEEE